MKRTIIGALLTFILACVIMYFEKFYQTMGLPNLSDISTLQSIAEKAAPLLLTPFSQFMNEEYTSIIAWGVAGFAGGAIAKSYARTLILSLINIGLAILIILAMPTALNAMYSISTVPTEYDWGFAVAAVLIAALVGSSLTMSEEEE
ncbi:MAG: hypothetical protein ACTSXW_08870 [Candidatus Baldrarchaeia archaeon]